MNHSKHPRSLKNMLLFPSVQMKYALLNTLFLAGLMFLSTVIIYLAFSTIRSATESAALKQYMSEMIQFVITINTLLLVGGSFLILVMNILITHRFLGPIVAIKRYFEHLKTNPNAKLILRENDELEPLAQYLETLKIHVEEVQSDKTK